jgi:hypothetical protein
MAAQLNQIALWYDRGVKAGRAYMAIRWDMFDGQDGDYPVFYNSREEAQQGINKPGDRLMEVYDLNGDREAQLGMFRCWALQPGDAE